MRAGGKSQRICADSGSAVAAGVRAEWTCRDPAVTRAWGCARRRPTEESAVNWWTTTQEYWRDITAWAAVIDAVLILVTVPWVLAIKKESISALAWCLLVILLPLLGVVFFILFGYQSVHRPLKRKRRHRREFRAKNPAARHPRPAGARQ